MRRRHLPLALALAAAFLALLAPAAGAQAPASLTVRVENPVALAREVETVAVPWRSIAQLPGVAAARVRVLDAASGRELVAQALDGDGDGQLDSLLFQGAFAPREVRLFTVEAAAPADSVRAGAHVKFVPDREDVAWESDRIAFRIYGKKLWELENLHSNGIDVWVKRTRKLVLDDWYSAGHDSYHIDRGEGADFFQVGPTLGAGGTGIWQADTLYRGDNFLSHRLVADGPVRAIFELDYGPIDARGLQATEHKRVSIDAGQNVFRQESTFRATSPGELQVAVGLVKRANMVGSTSKAAPWAWLSGWGPIAPGTDGHGDLGTAVLVARASLVAMQETDDHYLTISRVQPGTPLLSFVGAGWTASRDFRSAEDWWRYLAEYAQRLEHPLVVQVLPGRTAADTARWSVRMADAVLRRHPLVHERWDYTAGVALLAIEAVGRRTGEARFRDYVSRNMAGVVAPDGTIRGYREADYNLDQVNQGKVLFPLLERTGDQRYRAAARLLRGQLTRQPRTSDGGFWHKQVYPQQMWLDGVYMASPFLAQYAAVFGEDTAFTDVARQVLLAAKHTRDARTGLFYHGWDESRTEPWASRQTGASPSFWGRAMGWYAMALVDVLDYLPPAHPDRPAIIGVLQQLAAAVAAVQDPATGLWYQVLDQRGRTGNYPEASASGMFVYALAKGVRQGHLPARYLEVARRGYDGIVQRLVTTGPDGLPSLTGIVSVSGLGGKQQRNGTFEYYISEPVVADDYKGVGPFILASLELDR